MQLQKSYENHPSGTLYLVPTPIGNLEDMTFRAVRTLQEVDLIAAEDTRNTRKLLTHFEIDTPQISFHEHNTQERIPQLVGKLLAGQSIAQVSDAGMPSISDPGHELVRACIAADIPVVPLPGAIAGVTALVASGLAPQPFYFFGFLERKKKEQAEQLESLKNREETMIFYESPFRLKDLLKNIAAVMGGDRQVVICRELTKRFEEFIRGSAEELVLWAEETEIRGEICLMIAGNDNPEKPVEENFDELSLKELVEMLMAEQGLSSKDAIKEAAKIRNLKKQEVYQAYHGF
ncbi:tetrapyrrole methylase [Trichococcus palustris]|jgi:16S rRNA (cytidine1402-2'-O)-methyltransferase|uniref:Ribosomal RNA small subunit methyltransferase I n=1 Tax=Trichococcus palustris TaxID=140314 RepID=A0A143YM92_9LACT|nr:16S rRNA (cytidine(1402)-2'-O)-methyltransferase [Trichococcus palustris]CZQ94164.1 tetrapyrrole methylase [Trichococcus palustris]SFL18311.1 16S rRNA (cytidine1402-2'-O)-methyltransferase [Trichococcus palustris]